MTAKVLEFRGRLYVARPSLPPEIHTDAVALADHNPRGRRGRRRYREAVTAQCVELLRAAFEPVQIEQLRSVCRDDDDAWREVLTATAFMYKVNDLEAISR